MQRRPLSSLRPKNSEAQRCGQRCSMMPTRPSVSRKAMSCSPSSKSRIGSPSALSSEDRQAGTQYCRISSPIGVPGPTRVSNSFSICEVISWLLRFRIEETRWSAQILVEFGDPGADIGPLGHTQLDLARKAGGEDRLGIGRLGIGGRV